MRGDGSGAHRIHTFVRRKVPGHGYVYPPKTFPGSRGHVESLAISPEGSKLLIVRGYVALYTLRANGRHLRHLEVSGGQAEGYVGSDCCGPQFSPDGRRIIGEFTAEDGEGIGTIPAGGGKVSFILDRGFSATFSDDGRRIAFVATLPPPKAHPDWEGEWAIWVMSSDGRGAHLVLHREGLTPANPDFSPDGGRLTFSSVGTGGDGLIDIGKDPENTWVVGVDGSGLRRVGTGSASFNHGNPQWVR